MARTQSLILVTHSIGVNTLYVRLPANSYYPFCLGESKVTYRLSTMWGSLPQTPPMFQCQLNLGCQIKENSND